MRGEQGVGNLRQHRVGEVLHHELHPVSTSPTEAKQRPSLGLASLEGDAVPAQRASQSNEGPVMGAFIEEEGNHFAYCVHWNWMRFQIVGEGLFHVGQFFPEGRFLRR